MLTGGTSRGYCWAADLSAETGCRFSSRLLAQKAARHTHKHTLLVPRARVHTLTISLAWLNLEEHLTVKELQTRGVTHAGELPSLGTCTPVQRVSGLQ